MKEKRLMKKWICILLSVLMAVCPLCNENAIAAGDAVSGGLVIKGTVNDTFPAVGGGTAVLRADTTKDATVLIFGRTICGNTRAVLADIAQSGWVRDPNVKVMFGEINGADEAEVKAFMADCGCDGMTACYSVDGNMNGLMFQYWNKSGSVTLPVIVLLDKEGNVQETLSGYHPAGELYQEIKKFSNISGDAEDEKADGEISLTVRGEEDYGEAREVFQLVNETRAAAGKKALEFDAGLTETAMERAAEQSLYFSHTRPCGKNCFSLFRSGGNMGENIAAAHPTAQAVMNSWNNSPRHYANIIKDDYTCIGIGCFTDSNGMKYWVQCFDDGKADQVVKSGTQKVRRSIPILKSLIYLRAIPDSFTLSCAENKNSAQLDIRNANAEFKASTPRVENSDLVFSSSNPGIAEVDGNGMVSIREAGSVVITAALKDAPDISVKVNVSKDSHSYAESGKDVSGNPTYLCRVCGDRKGNPVENESGGNKVDETPDKPNTTPDTLNTTPDKPNTTPDKPNTDLSGPDIVPDNPDTVWDDEEEARLSQTSAVITAGFTKKLSVIDGEAAFWTSSNWEVATVNESGKVTAGKNGTAVITVETTSGQILKCRITVKKNEYKERKITKSDVKLGEFDMRPYKIYFDKKGNLIIKARFINRMSYKVVSLNKIKITVKDTNGKTVGVYKLKKKPTSVKSGFSKDYTFVIKKSGLKKKKADIREADYRGSYMVRYVYGS